MSTKIREPSDTDPAPPPPPPKSKTAPKDPYTDFRINTSEAGRVLPLIYGTVQTAGNVIERFTQTLGINGSGIYPKGTAFTPLQNQIVSNNGNIYICVTPGLTAGGDGPTGNGTAIVDGATTWSYTAQGYQHTFALAFCEGTIFGSGKWWADKNSFTSLSAMPWAAPNFYQLYLGDATGMSPVPVWYPQNASFPYARNYANTALLIGVINNGSDNSLPQIRGEVAGVFATAASGTGADASPADIAIDLVTHARRGGGMSSSRVDSVTTGTGAASWRTYCTAYGLNLSWMIDSQSTALDLLAQLLIATNTEAVWTNRTDGAGGMFKFVPLGDQGTTANGVTFTPSNSVAYDLGPDDLLEPVKVTRIPSTSTFNSIPVEYVDRAAGYVKQVVDDPEMADVDQRGLRRASTVSHPMVLQPATAIMLSRIYAQRSINVRRTFTIKLPWRFLLLEPTDLLTVTDPVMGLVKAPVRVIAVEENQAGDGSFTVTAEDWPAAVGSAAQYTPQAGDGYQPALKSPANGLVLVPAQLPSGTITDASSSRGANVDNLWPNPSSEAYPPDGADTTQPEWAGRVNIGASAYAGNWVRQANSSRVTLNIPACPGETYYFEAQIRAVTAGAGLGGILQIGATNASGAGLALQNSQQNDTASWVKEAASFTTPAGTTNVQFTLIGDSPRNAYFDSIYCRRVVDPIVLGKMGGYVIDELQGAALQAIGRTTTGSASTTPPTLAIQRSWYRGSNTNLNNNGAPNIGCLTLTPQVRLGANPYSFLLDLKLQPTSANDNLDGMRYAELVVYNQAGTGGTSGALSSPQTYRVALPDRGYKVPGTDTDTSNSVLVTYYCANPNISGVIAIKATLYGVNGQSETHCFYSGASYAYGTALIDNGQAWPAGITGGTAGGGSSGGNVGGGCLDPETPVLARPGVLVPLRTVREGDLLWTRPEGGGEMGFHRVERVKHTSNVRCMVSFSDGRYFACSINHLLNVRGLWRRADSLQPGEEVQGDPGGYVARIDYLGEGPVVQLTIPTAGTYFGADGIWQHNTLKP